MQSTPNAPSAVNLSDMHHLQSTSAASVYPNAPASAPSVPSAVSFSERGEGGGEAAELPDRSRWFHRVGDFFLGAPSLDLPVTAPAVHPTLDLLVGHPPPLTGGGDQDTTTTEAHTNEVPVIRWFCGFDFQRKEDNEALAKDGWRWRTNLVFVNGVGGAILMSIAAMIHALPIGFGGSLLSFWSTLAAELVLFALLHNSSYIGHTTAATILSIIAHLGLTSMCVCFLLVDTEWDWAPLSPSTNGSTPFATENTIEKAFDVWVRGAMVMPSTIVTFYFALLLPTSRVGRWVAIVYQLTALPALQVCGCVAVWRDD